MPSKKLRRFAAPAALALLAVCVAQAQEASHPSTFVPEGSAPLPIAGRAERLHLLGTVNLYSVALYAEGATRDFDRLSSPQASKVIRISINDENDPRRQVTIDWRRELIPPLDGRAIVQLRGHFGGLRRGDVVVIDYTPTKGTSIRINKGVVVSGIEHDLMLAFLDHWLGQRPVSEDMKQALLSGA